MAEKTVSAVGAAEKMFFRPLCICPLFPFSRPSSLSFCSSPPPSPCSVQSEVKAFVGCILAAAAAAAAVAADDDGFLDEEVNK